VPEVIFSPVRLEFLQKIVAISYFAHADAVVRINWLKRIIRVMEKKIIHKNNYNDEVILYWVRNLIFPSCWIGAYARNPI
jgi:hypothetical protein